MFPLFPIRAPCHINAKHISAYGVVSAWILSTRENVFSDKHIITTTQPYKKDEYSGYSLFKL